PIFWRALGSPFRAVRLDQGYLRIASLRPSSSPKRPCPFFLGAGASFSRAPAIEPPSDKNTFLAMGSLRILRRFRMSLEFVISLLLILRMMVFSTSGVSSFLLRFLISRAQVIDAPGSGRLVSFSDNS